MNLLAAILATLFFTTNDVPAEIEGVVTAHRRGDPYFFIVDQAGDPWRVASVEPKPRVAVGDRVNVSGVKPKHCATPRIERATFTKTGTGRPPVTVEMTVDEMYAVGPDGEEFSRNWFARVIAVSGPVLDVNRRETYTQILIGTKKKKVQVVVPINWNDPLPGRLGLGALIRARGVGVYTQLPNSHSGPVTGICDFNVLASNLDDVHVLGTPPFWTAPKIWTAAAALIALASLPFFWAQRRRRLERIAADGARRERLRLTGELHDNFQQLLAGCMFLLGAAQGKIRGGDSAKAGELLEKLRASLNHTQATLRGALWGLTEEAEGPGAFTELFKYAAGRMPQWEGKVRFTIRGRERAVARKCSGALLLILLEAVGNALRHGGANEVNVIVDFADDALIFGVNDDGCGFDPSTGGEAGHLGLDNMKKHAEGLGGTLKITSAPGRGTSVVVRLPGV